MFSISCFEGSTCLTNIVFGTVITFKFVNTCGYVFFMFGVVCCFVCEVSFVVYAMLYSRLLKLLSIFCVHLLSWFIVKNCLSM